MPVGEQERKEEKENGKGAVDLGKKLSDNKKFQVSSSFPVFFFFFQDFLHTCFV